jgi:riboflavin biosynthesis pyrimidine reductase
MISSADGCLHLSRCTKSPDGDRAKWSTLYEQIHQDFGGNAWIVGRVTMAEMSKGTPHPPAKHRPVARPYHIARHDAGCYAVAIDLSGKLHFAKPDIGGDHVVVLLGPDVPDSHLADLAGDGVSYIVLPSAKPDPATMLDILGRELGIRLLLLEGGAIINGSFLAAGLVDELSLLIAPSLYAKTESANWITFGEEGLAGKVQLSLTGCTMLDHGVVHLRYAVTPG